MLDIERYNTNYYNADGKIVDNWKTTISLLPYSLQASTSGFDKNCELSGITGEFFRKWGKLDVEPIQDFETDVEGPVLSYLQDTGKMKQKEQNDLTKVIKDIVYPDGKLSVIDASFLPYLPLVDTRISKTRVGKKYIDGQKKLADYLYSMLDDKEMPEELKGESNLFSESIRKGIERGRFTRIHDGDKFYILPFVKELFNADLKWLMKREDYVIIKNIDYLLHFYACLSIAQSIAHLVHWKDLSPTDAAPFYYILSSEHASASREVVETGWEKWISRESLQKLLGRAQALDIFNTLAGENAIGFYSQVIETLKDVDFEQNRKICSTVLERYHKNKYELLSKRANINVSDLPRDFDYSVGSYEEFFEKLTQLCRVFQSPDYNARLEKKVRDLFEIKFLRNRKGFRVLVLDDDILIFLIAMITKEERTKLDEMYKLFNKYGIFFDMNTRVAIETQLTKLNLLDRKSDSGEAQYVRVIL